MNDQQLESLRDAKVPPARDEARSAALAAALAVFETSANTVMVSRGPRPFMLRHGYKIAASLALICVIGPLLLSPLIQSPQHDEVMVRPVDVTTKKAQVAEAKVLPLAPPVILAQPARDAHSGPVVGAAATGPTAGSTERPAIVLSPTAPLPSAIPAPDALAPKTMLVEDCPSGRQCLRIQMPPGLKVPAQPQPMFTSPALPRAAQAPDVAGPVAAPEAGSSGSAKVDFARLGMRRELSTNPDLRAVERLRTALDAGRWPVPGEVDVASIISSVPYDGVPLPTAPIELVQVAVVAAPWSAAHKLVIVLARLPAGYRLDLTTTMMLRSQGTMTFGASSRFSGPTLLAASPPRFPTIGGMIEFMWEAAPPADGRYGSIDVALFEARSTTDMRVSIPVTTRQEVPDIAQLSTDQRLALAVARFGQLLRGDAIHPAKFDLDAVVALADSALGPDPTGERAAFVALMRRAKALRR